MNVYRFTVVSTLAAAALISGSAVIANAAVLNPINATASSELSPGLSCRTLWLDRLAEEGNLQLFHHDDPDVMNWYHDADTSGASQFLTDKVTVADQWVKVDLGDTGAPVGFDVTKLYLWQYSQTHPTAGDLSGRGVKNFTVWGSMEENGIYKELSGSLELAREPSGNNPILTQAFDLTNGSGVRWIKIDIDSNWNGNATDYTGLAQICAEGTATIPEPSVVALLFTGLVALLAYAWRRRK